MARAPRVAVTITADSTGYSASVNKAQAQLIQLGEVGKRVGRETSSSVYAASGALRTLEGSIPIRAAERFLTILPGIGTALQVAFPVFGAIALINVLKEGAERLAGFVKATREAGEKFQQAFQEMANASRLSNDELERSNIQLENQIAKLTGKHENVLRSELIDARIEADKLAMSSAEAAKKVKELLEQNKASVIDKLLGSDSTSEVFGNIQNFGNLRHEAAQRRSDALHVGDQGAADKAQAEYDQLLKNEQAYYREQIASRQKQQFVTRHVSTGPGSPGYDLTSEDRDQTKNLTALRGALSLSYDEQDRLSHEQQHTKDVGDDKRAEDAKRAGEQAREAASRQMEMYRQQLANQQASLTPQVGESSEAYRVRELTEQADFWAKKLDMERGNAILYAEIKKQLADVDRQANQQYAQALNENARLQEEQQKLISSITGDDLDLSRSSDTLSALRSMGKDAEDYKKALQEQAEGTQHNADAQREAQIALDASTGAISKQDAVLAMASLHAEQYRRALDQLQAAQAGLERQYGPLTSDSTLEAKTAYANLQAQMDALQSQRAIQSAADASAMSQNTGIGSMQQTLDEFVQASRDSAAQVKDIWSSSFSAINDELVKMISSRHNYGLRQQWSNIGASMFRNVTNAGLQKAEGLGMQMLGFGGGPDGSENKPFHVITHALKGMANGAAGVFNDVKGAIGDKAGGGTIGTAADFMSHLVGFAGGGDVGANIPIMVGEQGPEPFIPKTAGTIIPNKALGGVTHNWNLNVDARGAGDPAAVESVVNRAFQRHAPTMIAASLQANREQQARRPASRR